VLGWALTPFSERFRLSFEKNPATVVIVGALAIPITIFWIRNISRRRANGLRWAWGVLSILGIYIIVEAWQQRAHYPVWSAISGGEVLEGIITTWLLFTGDAVAWFRKAPVTDPAIFD